MLRFSLIHHRRTTKPCSVFLPLSSVYRSNRPVTCPYRSVYRSVPNELAFQFGIWICSVSSGNRSLPTGLPKPTAGDSGDQFGKLNPALGGCRQWIEALVAGWMDECCGGGESFLCLRVDGKAYDPSPLHPHELRRPFRSQGSYASLTVFGPNKISHHKQLYNRYHEKT
jgi:hypothetical protein